jgi:hypothetical protein
MYVSTKGPPSPTNNTWFRVGGYNPLYLNLCPSDAEYKEDTTYFLALQGITEVAQINVILEPAMPQPLYTPTDVVPTPAECVGIAEKNLTSSHECIADGVTLRNNFTEVGSHYYYYNVTNVTGCAHVMMMLDCIPTGMDADIYVSTSVVNPGFGTSDYASYTTGDDYLYFMVCPQAGQDWIPLWVTINGWVRFNI